MNRPIGKPNWNTIFWSDCFVTSAFLRKNREKECADTRVVPGELGLIKQKRGAG
jgi:hypothetical protein